MDREPVRPDALSWKDVEWVKSLWPGKLILKGILDADDAKIAVKTGADAISVSNHGGRQLDGAPSAISALPRVADAVGSDIEVMFDSGVRTGADIMRALALGARSCIVGRAYIFGLGAGGQAGVAHASKSCARSSTSPWRCAASRASPRSTASAGRHAIAKEPAMKIPGPDHPITITPSKEHVRVTFNGKVVADTKRALVLQEAAYKPVFYIPREDAQMDIFARTTNSTHCPYKGDASYYTIKVGDKASENAIWSYETPFPAMKEIEGHLAFYPNRVDKIEATAA